MMIQRQLNSRANAMTSPIIEDYLVTILRLENIYGIAKTCKIAEELNVTPATVSKVLEKLVAKGYITWNKYQGVKLSDKGKSEALRVLRKHRIMEKFLEGILGFDKYKAHIYAHSMEHIPDEVVEKVYELLGRPSTCPHGNPITPTLEQQEENYHTLDEGGVGSCYRVIRILGELNSSLKKIIDMGINVGILLRVKDKNTTKIIIEMLDHNIEREVDIEHARLIQVTPVKDCKVDENE